jgi:hypothetical protein
MTPLVPMRCSRCVNLFTRPSSTSTSKQYTAPSGALQRGDNHTIMLMLERNQVVRASLHTRLIKKYYEYRQRTTNVYQDLWIACKRHW